MIAIPFKTGRVCKTLATVAALLLTSSLLWGQTPLFVADFQTQPLGPVTDGVTGANPANGSSIVINQDTDDRFGKGENFKYLNISKHTPVVTTSALAFTMQNAFTPASVVTVSFLMYEPTGTDTDALSLYFGQNALSGGDLGGYISMVDGRIYGTGGPSGANSAAYTLGQPLRFDIVINNSTAAYNYGEQTLAGQRFDVWVNGVNILENAAFLVSGSNKYSGDMSTLRLAIGSGTNKKMDQEIWFGEFGVFEGGVVGAPLIPEPGSTLVVIAGAGMGACLVCRWRKKHPLKSAH